MATQNDNIFVQRYKEYRKAIAIRNNIFEKGLLHEAFMEGDLYTAKYLIRKWIKPVDATMVLALQNIDYLKIILEYMTASTIHDLVRLMHNHKYTAEVYDKIYEVYYFTDFIECDVDLWKLARPSDLVQVQTDETCPICWGNTACLKKKGHYDSHAVCKQCADMWFSTNNRCPYCNM